MRHHPHHKWQYNLNHPVDMPNKRRKITPLQSIAIPATVYMAVEAKAAQTLQPIAEADTPPTQ